MSEKLLYEMFSDDAKSKMVGRPMKIQRSTAIWRDTQGRVHIRYFETDILTFFDPDDEGVYHWVELNPGDWPIRLNDFLHACEFFIYEKDQRWLVQHFRLKKPLPFREGMRLPVRWKSF